MDLDLSNAEWRTSTRSQGNGQCVEVATNIPGVAAVRDSKNPEGPALVFMPADWRTFLAGVKSGKFDAA
ncbi:DUF397 domain-containing protein [Streptosporangium sp. NPDC002524]|uniref:DUF397 domain-containing protein n=1 Tax=Streptosporangium sp. NPDC002524 TaxID=3154537 RepID=UPI003322B54F